MDQALATALEHNPALRASIEASEAAVYDLAARRSAFMPKLELRARDDSANNVLGVPGDRSNKVVEAVVKFLMDIIALAGGSPSFDKLSLGFGDNELYYGPVITAIVAFIILAAVVYFVVVKPYEAASVLLKKEADTPEEAPDPQVELLKEIRDSLRARG